MPVRSSNQIALGRSKALAYRTAGGVFLEAELTVHGTHRTLAADKGLLFLRSLILIFIFLGNRLFT